MFMYSGGAPAVHERILSCGVWAKIAAFGHLSRHPPDLDGFETRINASDRLRQEIAFAASRR